MPPLGSAIAVYGHIHRPYYGGWRNDPWGEQRRAANRMMGIDGLSYLVIEGERIIISAVEYEVERRSERAVTLGCRCGMDVGILLAGLRASGVDCHA